MLFNCFIFFFYFLLEFDDINMYEMVILCYWNCICEFINGFYVEIFLGHLDYIEITTQIILIEFPVKLNENITRKWQKSNKKLNKIINWNQSINWLKYILIFYFQ